MQNFWQKKAKKQQSFAWTVPSERNFIGTALQKAQPQLGKKKLLGFAGKETFIC